MRSEGSNYWVAFVTIFTKEVARLFRIWMQVFVPPVVTMSLYFIIFGHLIGRRIGTMGGVDYMQYIAPGLVMMAVIQNAYMNTCSSFFGAKMQRHLEELLVAPIPRYIVILGYMAGGVARGILIGAVVMGISLFFTHLSIHHAWIVVLITLCTAVLFSLAGLINALFAKDFDDVGLVPTFVLTPLTYLGGVFYSIHWLPDFWRHFSKINPILYMVNIFRYGVLGISDVPVYSALVVVVLFSVFLFMVCLYLFKKGVGFDL